MPTSRNANELVQFRAELYGCLLRWSDALFELTDALLCATGPVHSVPSLSLEPEFSRSHGSLYKSLAEGRIDERALRALLVAHLPSHWPLVFAVDASTWARSDAECSPERGFHYSASHHSAGQPIVAGWSYQWISQLCWTKDSWTAPADVARLSPAMDATGATIDQVARLVGLLPTNREVPLFVFDAGYDAASLAEALATVRCEVLVRISSARVFHHDPPPRQHGERGRPARHGPRFVLSDETTWGPPDDEVALADPSYGDVRVRAWRGLHQKLHGRGRRKGVSELPIVRGTVIRVDVEHLPKPCGRADKTLWLFWSGPGEADLERCFRAYLRRFDIEHAFRFAKGTLGWTTPQLCTPAQADRWSWIVVASYSELRLARGLVADLRLPWERPCEPARLTPSRVRRGFRRLRAALGTPAVPPKSRTPGPGRPKGTRKPPRTCYPAVKKAA